MHASKFLLERRICTTGFSKLQELFFFQKRKEAWTKTWWPDKSLTWMNFSTESFVGHGILPKQLELRRSISTWQRIDVTLPWKSRAPARLWRRRFQNESSLVSQSNHRSCGRFTEWVRNYHCPWILYVPDTICSLNWRWRKFCIRDIQVTHRSLLDDSKAC